MKEPPESPTSEFALQDKKNHATNKSVEKQKDSTFYFEVKPKVRGKKKTKQQHLRIAEATNFLNILYGKITASHFAYLWTKQRGIFSFAVSDESQRMAMALKAVQLSNSGVDIWHSVNTVSTKPADGKRGDETVVSYQTAIVVDIDIRSDAHKGDSSLLATDSDEAKSFLPFNSQLNYSFRIRASRLLYFQHSD